MTAYKQTKAPLCVTFISSNHSWGGSEELWSATAAVLARRGHRVTVLKAVIERDAPRIQELAVLGCKITDLTRILFLPRRIFAWLQKISNPMTRLAEAAYLFIVLSLSRRPDLVVLSQGGNFDGWLHGKVCAQRKLPYALIVHKATDLYWPADSQRLSLKQMYREARWSFFVSEHNRRLTQEQFALALPRSSVIRNTYLVPKALRTDWPDSVEGLRLACVGRLYPREKGQDLLLRVLARDKWRGRALTVTFYGAGEQAQGLAEMAGFLGLKSVSFAGFVSNVSAAIWDNHHGLVLASRCEGLPLVAVESMLSARVPILTDVGGARELIDDNVSGFVAAAATEDALDEALERAWQRRDEWRAMGALAQERARALIPLEPEVEFANVLEQLASPGESTLVPHEPCQTIDGSA